MSAGKIDKGFVPVAVPTDAALLADAQKLTEQRAFKPADLEALTDRYVKEILSSNVIVGGRHHGAAGTVLNVPFFKKVEGPSENDQLTDSMRRRMAGVGLELLAIWKNGLLEEHELKPLEKTLERLADVLKLQEALPYLDRQVAASLEPSLDLLQRLYDSANAQRTAMYAALEHRDGQAVQERLDKPVALYAPANELEIARFGMSGLERFHSGDFVVAGDDGKLAIVTGEARDGKIRAERIGHNGRLQVIELDAQDVLKWNPLKIGDRFELADGRQLYVKPSLDHGIQVLELQVGQLRDVSTREALGLVAPRDMRTSLGERIVPPQTELTVKGGEGTGGVKPIGNHKLGVIGAVYSMPKPGAAESHDSVTFKIVRDDLIVVGLGDGTSNGGSRVSGTVVEALVQAADAIAGGEGERRALDNAFHEAKDSLAAVSADVFSTVTGMILRPIKEGWEAHTIQAGDSMAWHFSGRGGLKNQTSEQNAARRLADEGLLGDVKVHHAQRITNCVSSEEDGNLEHKSWKLDPGDFVVMVSHGGTQANLEGLGRAAQQGEPFELFHTDVTRLQIASLIASSDSAAEATEKIRGYIQSQWDNGSGRKSDLSIAVVAIPG